MGHIFSRETGVSEIASENRDADDEITDASVNNTNSEEFSDHLTPSNGNSASNENAEQSGVVEEPSQEENLASNENTEQSGVVGEPSQEENLASNENTEQSASGSVKNQQELAGRDEGLVSDATTESSAVKPGDFKGFKTKNEDTIMNILKKQPGESIKDYGDRLDKSLKPLTLALGVLSSGVGLTSMVMSVENHEESEKKDDTSSSSENSGSDTLPYISKAPDLNQV
ncbi:hypothetical protein [Acetobacter thailandicus]|uniref:hypothetical protein n=1 Tax=Acetobacter thailandicus TaxID=1502842 RepID=UPI001BA9765D|nr:hypothetical protein [Acetobacter thailandicus]MBS0960411.1 hypothetical protein [Acetobacter thailandicus]MBS1004354.1 hypothetical protein [Acetobacter thailandicus]